MFCLHQARSSQSPCLLVKDVLQIYCRKKALNTETQIRQVKSTFTLEAEPPVFKFKGYALYITALHIFCYKLTVFNFQLFFVFNLLNI